MEANMNRSTSIKQNKVPPTERADQIQTLTSGNFDELVLKATGPIAVEFMSYGCEHCRALEPILQQVSEMMLSKAKIFRVNVELEPELAQSYKIEGTPTMIMFLNGKKVGRAEGPTPTVPSILTALAQPYRSAK